jgi:flagellar assembly protein FliH
MAGVIRKETSPRPGAFSFADLERQGQAIIERARAEAREIVAAARREALAVSQRERHKGHDEGLAQGRAAGLEQIRAEAHADAVREAQQEVASFAHSLSSALAEFEQSKRSLLAAAESGIIELALRIAQRVCKLEAGASTAAALANARTLLEMAEHAEDVELCFHPAEFELLQEMGPELAAAAQRCAHAQLVADETVERGGCRLRSRAGQIDAGIEVQLQRIAEALRVGSEPSQRTPERSAALPAPDCEAGPAGANASGDP